MSKPRDQYTSIKINKSLQASYGIVRGVPYLELHEKKNRWAIYGNCRSNIERIRGEIADRGIKVSSEFLAALNGSNRKVRKLKLICY